MKQNFSLLPSETLWLMHFLPEMELPKYLFGASQVALVVKNLPANSADAKDVGSIPGSGRSSGEGNGNPLPYPGLENSMDRGAHGVTKSQARTMVALFLVF